MQEVPAAALTALTERVVWMSPAPVALVHRMDVLRLPGCAFAKSQHRVFFYDVTFCKVLASGVLYGLKLLRLKLMFWELYNFPLYFYIHKVKK